MQNSFFSTDFSISTWVLLDNFNNTYPTFVTQQNRYLCLQFANTVNPPVVNFYFLNNFQIPGQQVEDGHVNGGAITLNTWFNVVIVNYNKINKLYINGVFVSSSTSPSVLQGLGLGNYLRFGNGVDLDLPDAEFNVKLDDIGIWNRALTQDEIISLYQAEVSCQSLVINSGTLSNFNPPVYQSTVTIYPNPANDQITIDCGNLENVVGWNIKITNMLGQEVFNQPMNTQQYVVPLNTWSGQGMYFVKIINAQNEVVNIKKIILQ